VTALCEARLAPHLPVAEADLPRLRPAIPAARAGWYYQQLLKLALPELLDAAAVTPPLSDVFVVWDGDTVPLRGWRWVEDAGRTLLAYSTVKHAMARLAGAYMPVQAGEARLPEGYALSTRCVWDGEGARATGATVPCDRSPPIALVAEPRWVWSRTASCRS
jgi:hypothetical protein